MKKLLEFFSGKSTQILIISVALCLVIAVSAGVAIHNNGIENALNDLSSTSTTEGVSESTSGMDTTQSNKDKHQSANNSNTEKNTSSNSQHSGTINTTSTTQNNDKSQVNESLTSTSTQPNKLPELQANELLNYVTKKASTAQYMLERKCELASAISAERFSNDLMDALEIGTTQKSIPRNSTPSNSGESKYLLKAMNTQSSDFTEYKQEGNKHIFHLVNCYNPNRNGNVPLYNVTNDFITPDELNIKLNNFNIINKPKNPYVKYGVILIVATIENDRLVELEISYDMLTNAFQNDKETEMGYILGRSYHIRYYNFEY